MLDLIKKRPYWFIGGLIVAIVGYVLLTSGSSTPGTNIAPAGEDPTSVAAATAIQQAQIVAASRSEELHVRLAGLEMQTAAQLEATNLAAQLSEQQIAAQKAVALEQLASNVQLATLAAQVEQADIAADTARQKNAIYGQVQIANIYSGIVKAQTTASYNLQKAFIQSNERISIAETRASVKLAKIADKDSFGFSLGPIGFNFSG